MATSMAFVSHCPFCKDMVDTCDENIQKLKEGMKEWKAEFEKKTMTTFRVVKKFKDDTQRLLYKEIFCCQHSASRQSKGIYNTKKTGCNCKAKLTMAVSKVPLKYRGKNPHLPHRPASVTINWKHSHAIQAASALRYRDVSDTVNARLIELFHSGPAQALEILQLEADNSPTFVTLMGDRHYIPDYHYVWYLHKKSFEDIYGKYTGPISYSDIIRQVGELDTDMNFKAFHNDSYFVVALVTPLMLRVHEFVYTKSFTM